MKELVVQTTKGKLQGVREDGCIVFKGVPYAKAAVGDLRFRAPQPLDPWEGILAADTYGNRCAQVDDGEDNLNVFAAFYQKEFYTDPVLRTPITDDSLCLNIWVPDKETAAPLPVAFYIHGGGFGGGCGHELEFRTHAYAQKDVILVTINYRLSVSGFLALPQLAQEDPVAVGNYGMLDQVAALTWVQDNIAAFGGDPRNVTIFGQSAGCMSVHTLLGAPRAKGLFAKAILQSGAGYPQIIDHDVLLEEAYRYGRRVLEKAGTDSVEGLRSLPLVRLLEVQAQVSGEMMAEGSGLVFRPVLNGSFREETYDVLMEQGRLYDVPVMIGSTKNDITVRPEETAGGKRSQFQKNCISFALKNEEVGHCPAYVYYFTRDLPGDDAGAFHSSELWYTFGTLGSCWRPMTDADYALSERMVSYWTNFMKTGDPNGDGLAQWQTCTKEHPFEMVLDVE